MTVPLIFHVVTIFPGMFESPFAESVVSRGIEAGLVKISLTDIRDYTTDRHHKVDDYPFGGAPGMLMKPEPLFAAVEGVKSKGSLDESTPVILMTPQGRPLTQSIVEDLSIKSDIMLICGRYEGIDERVRQHLVTDEISIGDYVLSGGELGAMVIIDVVSRLVPGVVGSIESTEDDSFTSGLLQGPMYTRPAEFRGMSVPDVVLSGNHAEIAKWRRLESLRRTHERRPELIDYDSLTDAEKRFLDET